MKLERTVEMRQVTEYRPSWREKFVALNKDAAKETLSQWNRQNSHVVRMARVMTTR